MKFLKAHTKTSKLASTVMLGFLTISSLCGQSVDLENAIPTDSTELSIMYTPKYQQIATFTLHTIEQGYFCKKENQRDRKNAWGLRMRLGNLDYVNTLERK